MVPFLFEYRSHDGHIDFMVGDVSCEQNAMEVARNKQEVGKRKIQGRNFWILPIELALPIRLFVSYYFLLNYE